ncbi:hypothetical protein [Nonomuraea sp. NPDC023979]|uniref:hypothetical protein n=1 Tax=Nonomuraea sp. NPDC023979 TaxID=3154796 RepID=UPI0033EE7918
MSPMRLWKLVQEAPTWLEDKAAREAERRQLALAALDELVDVAAGEAHAAPPPAVGEDLTRGQMFALFGRAGVTWWRAGVTARFANGDVRLRNGPIMLGAIAVDPASSTVTGPFRVFLWRNPLGDAYVEIPLARGVLPVDPIQERRRRLPARGPRAVH